MDRLDKETKCTLKFLHDGLGKNREVDVRLLLEEVLGKLGDALSVGLCLKPETLAFQESSELLVVGNDTIVNDGKFPAQVRSVGAIITLSANSDITNGIHHLACQGA